MRGSVVYGCMSVRGNARSRAVFKDSGKEERRCSVVKVNFQRRSPAQKRNRRKEGTKERRNEL